MKYRFLLVFLRFLIALKRLVWKCGALLGSGAGRAFVGFWRVQGSVRYRVGYALRKIGISWGKEWWYKRAVVHTAMLGILVLIALPHTSFSRQLLLASPGQKTFLYTLLSENAEATEIYEEAVASDEPALSEYAPWRAGAFQRDSVVDPVREAPGYDVLAERAGGLAVLKPTIMPGVYFSGRSTVELYTVESGDSLYSIAADYGVSIATILWENNLTTRSILQPGNTLKIPPVSGVMHTVARGDTISKIARLYSAEEKDIVSFNQLNPNGSNLIAGERIMVPGGAKSTAIGVTPTRPTTPSRPSAPRVTATPPPSRETASVSGYVWPSGARTVTQSYGIRHHALDIAGPFHTPNYASNAGRVVTANCPPVGQYRGKTLNSGYGCYVIIDHGGGIKTLYGHNDVILVAVGDYVERGQTIGLMGNTGNVRGVTGIHLHFEVIRNGVRVNPYGYVR